MDRVYLDSRERPTSKNMQDQSAPGYLSTHPPDDAQLPMHLPYVDPYHSQKDHFYSSAPSKRDAYHGTSAWSPQANIKAATTSQGQPLATPSSGFTPAALAAQMPPLLDATQRRSSASSPSSQQYGRSSMDSGPAPVFPSRTMPPPPSPPQMGAPSSNPPSLHHHSNSHGTLMMSPYSGFRDFGASHRSVGGMSISSMLGGVDEGKNSDTAFTFPNGSPMNVRSSSPGRARSASFRDMTGYSEGSPARAQAYAEPRASSAFVERSSERRKGSGFGSIRFPKESAHSFRSFQPQRQEPHRNANQSYLGRPLSQPSEALSYREEQAKNGIPTAYEAKLASFRADESTSRHAQAPVQDEQSGAENMNIDEQRRYDPSRYPTVHYGVVAQEQPAVGFRPVQNQVGEHAHESIESRHNINAGRENLRSSPAASDVSKPERDRGHALSFEEQPRSSATPQSRRAIEGSLQRSVFSISPELHRKGRNSPLPQAVQGVQPRHIGPGGDNPGIKIEFGRMFSGLGSGVGSTPPISQHAGNGTTTPSRPSPMRQLDDIDSLEDGKSSSKTSRGSMKRTTSRRSQIGVERLDTDDPTPGDAVRGAKRARVTHHHHHHRAHPHHHHHYHHEAAEPQSGSFSMLRFPSSSVDTTQTAATSHHHHHHAAHTHSNHHHHHRPAPPIRKTTVTVLSRRVVEDCAQKPRKHLGSQLYSAEIAMPPAIDVSQNRRTNYHSTARSIPQFEERENCTFTVRVPRWYFEKTSSMESDDMSPFEEICRRRQVWGADVYSDDSDVVAAAVHSGWLEGDFGVDTKDLRDLAEPEAKAETRANTSLSILKLPTRPVKPRPHLDVHITVLILPPLETYVSTMQNHILSREWRKTHDGMSFMVHRIDFVDEGPYGRSTERTATARKARIGAEEAKRQEAANGLLMFARAKAAEPPPMAA